MVTKKKAKKEGQPHPEACDCAPCMNAGFEEELAPLDRLIERASGDGTEAVYPVTCRRRIGGTSGATPSARCGRPWWTR